MRFVLERLYEASMAQPDFALITGGPIDQLKLNGLVESVERQGRRLYVSLESIDVGVMEQAVKDMGMGYLKAFRKLGDGESETCLAVYMSPPEVEVEKSEGVFTGYSLRGNTSIYSPSIKIVVLMDDRDSVGRYLDAELTNRYLHLMTESRKDLPKRPENFRN